MKRRMTWLAAVTAAVLLASVPAAAAKYLGTDVLGNIGPESRAGSGTLMDRYPLSAYGLDSHVDVGVTDLDGVAPTIAHWAAAQLWSVTSFLVHTMIELFTWAFSLDLLGGDPARAGDGALAPVAAAISSLYENVIGQAWMVAAITAAGIWGIWRALVQRRYTETAAGLGVSVLFVVIAMFFVYQPERTVGQASEWTNTLSLAFLSGVNRGTVENPEQARRAVADALFTAQVYRPWVVLNFGGTEHCVDTSRRNDDGYPTPVAPHDPAADVCRNHLRAGEDGHGGYAPRFLKHPPGSEDREAEYEALRKGEVPALDPQFTGTGYRVDKSDSPAVDIQQAGGAYQRLTLAVIVFCGALGAVVLLGFLSLAVILAQILALVLLAFAPVALVAGIIPGRGHDFFRNWLAKLATAVFIKALYSLVIAIVVAVSGALMSATASLGFLFAFALQGIFFWAIFLYRRQLTARLVSATTGDRHDGRMPHLWRPKRGTVERGASIAARPLTALASRLRGRGPQDDGRQESALSGTSGTQPMPATTGTVAASGAPAAGAAPASSPVREHRGRPLADSPAQAPGRSGASGAVAAEPPVASAQASGEQAHRGGRSSRPEDSPLAAHEAAMQRVRRRHAGGESERAR